MNKLCVILAISLCSCATKKTSDYYLQLGKNEAAQTDANAAIEHFTKAIKKNPNCIEAYMERANASMSIDSIANAITDYDSLLAKTDQKDYERRGKLLLMKGDAYYRMSEDTLACRCYKQAKGLNNLTSWDRLRDRCKK